jgi:hypothetical protein
MMPGETIQSGAPVLCPDCRREATLLICTSAAGYYVGTWCDCGPYSRESGYFERVEEAEKALRSGTYGR